MILFTYLLFLLNINYFGSPRCLRALGARPFGRPYSRKDSKPRNRLSEAQRDPTRRREPAGQPPPLSFPLKNPFPAFGHPPRLPLPIHFAFPSATSPERASLSCSPLSLPLKTTSRPEKPRYHSCFRCHVTCEQPRIPPTPFLGATSIARHRRSCFRCHVTHEQARTSPHSPFRRHSHF